MPSDRFMIAPFDKGLQENVRPWLISDDAFAELTNAYVFRGRVRKRFGSQLMNSDKATAVAPLYSRLRIALSGGACVGITDGAGAATGTVPGAVFKIGQAFSIGDEIFTVTVLGAPGVMITTGASTTMTYNTTTGAYAFDGADATTQIYFYPAEPVMGISTLEKAEINYERTIAFDTQFAYQYNGVSWERLGTGVWTGTDYDFFWAINYRGSNDYDNLVFVTNNKVSEMMYWDGTTWTAFAPVYNSATAKTIKSARLIVSFKDRLLLLNTVEDVAGTNRSFPNRVRYSQNGTPVAANSFYANIPGKGDKIDAPTRQAIISAKVLKDRLIVFFERSTWELAYTHNDVEPFVWQELNAELGCESTFSIVPFDKAVLGIGDVGIHACNGMNVERIDKSIPDEVFSIHNKNDGVFRVHGVRDYSTELVYWTFPSQNDVTYPNKVLVFNYKNNSWAFNDDTFTAWGYYQNQSDITWEISEKTWQETLEIWNSGVLESKFRQVIGGNQQGYVFIVSSNTSRNAPSLQLTNITNVGDEATIVMENHNLSAEDFVLIENAQGITSLNDKIYQVVIVDEDTVTVVENDGITGTYTGGGTAARVSRIDIRTKQYNFYVKKGKNALINKVNFYVDKTTNGQITVDSFPSASQVSLLDAGTANNSIVGTNILETTPYDTIPLEASQARIWHPIYLQAEGEVIQLRLYMNDKQMTDVDITSSDFQLNAMLFFAQPVGRLQ